MAAIMATDLSTARWMGRRKGQRHIALSRKVMPALAAKCGLTQKLLVWSCTAGRRLCRAPACCAPEHGIVQVEMNAALHMCPVVRTPAGVLSGIVSSRWNCVK